MKRLCVFTAALFLFFKASAQPAPVNGFLGRYEIDFYPSRKLDILQDGNDLYLSVVGQGKTMLQPLEGNRYKANLIPGSIIEFLTDSTGQTNAFKWIHPPPGGQWVRADGPGTSNPDTVTGALAAYTGQFSLKGNRYMISNIRAERGFLIQQTPGESALVYAPLGKNKFIFTSGNYSSVLEFIPDKKGIFRSIQTEQSGDFLCSRVQDSSETLVAKHVFPKRSGYTHADTLRGMLSPLRTCYDVLFYDLNLNIHPESHGLDGQTTIRFKTLFNFQDCQIDLFANMKISRILYHEKDLSFTRMADAVFIHFPDSLPKGNVEEIIIEYAGTPQVPNIENLAGGFIWTKDKNGKPWIESVVQGAGASLWYPCKDHLSDKPDSMHISISVPEGLTVISNGQLIAKTALANQRTQFRWAVHYPINNYNAVIYIGDYAEARDEYISDSSRFALKYYFLSYHPELAAQYAKHVKPMLALYEKDFGPYPFPADGFALVESPYAMEHQGAVSAGYYAIPSNGKGVDSIDLIRTIFHESAHEWWGNSVTCADMADFWIHESFATYAEVLAFDAFYGKAAVRKYLENEMPLNKESIIGVYNVNDFHMGDMYPKGARMIATLRHTMNNDSLFFSILRGIQHQFKYQSVTTADIVNYFNRAAGSDYTYLFNQYLRYAAIPVLAMNMQKSGTGADLRYRWIADVKDFRLPVNVIAGNQHPVLLNPTTDWQTIHIENCKLKEIKADNQSAYFDIKYE